MKNVRCLLVVMNSKYANVLLDSIRGAGNIDVNPEYIRNIPILAATSEQQEPLIKLADAMHVRSKACERGKETARRFLRQRCGPQLAGTAHFPHRFADKFPRLQALRPDRGGDCGCRRKVAIPADVRYNKVEVSYGKKRVL